MDSQVVVWLWVWVPEIKFKTLIVFKAQVSQFLIVLCTFENKAEAE